MYIYIYMYMYVYVYVCVYIYIYIYIYPRTRRGHSVLIGEFRAQCSGLSVDSFATVGSRASQLPNFITVGSSQRGV